VTREEVLSSGGAGSSDTIDICAALYLPITSGKASRRYQGVKGFALGSAGFQPAFDPA
jgi:hypothetical protein